MATKKSAAAAKSTAVTTKKDAPPPANLPDYLSGHSSSGLVGLDSSDFIVPRIKLLQGLSPELETHDNAKQGMFWLNVLDEPLSEVGGSLKFIPISNRKRYLLMAPRGDDRSILARADDGIHWNPPNAEFEVRLKGVKNAVKWRTAPTVKESGLDQFGSSNPDDPDSNPAAVLMYEYLVYLPDFPDYSPVLMSLSRSQAKKAKDLNGKIELRRVPMQAQLYEAGIIKDSKGGDEYWNYKFVGAGWASEEQFHLCKDLADRYADYRGADEEGAAEDSTGGGAPVDSSDF